MLIPPDGIIRQLAGFHRHFLLGEYEQARAAIVTFTGTHPDSPLGYHYTSELLLRVGNRDLAEEGWCHAHKYAVDTITSKTTDQHLLLLREALHALDQCDPVRAIQEFAKVLFHRRDGILWANVGTFLELHELREEAAHCYKEALHQGIYECGVLLHEISRHWILPRGFGINLSVPCRRSIVSRFVPDSDEFREFVRLVDEQNHAAILTARGELLRQFPGNVTIQGKIIEALFATGNPNDAINTAKSYVQVDPRNPTRYHNLGATLMQAGLKDQAIAPLKHALDLWPDDALAWARLAGCWQKLGQIENAVHSITWALQYQPLVIDFWDILAQYHHTNRNVAIANRAHAVANYLALLQATSVGAAYYFIPPRFEVPADETVDIDVHAFIVGLFRSKRINSPASMDRMIRRAGQHSSFTPEGILKSLPQITELLLLKADLSKLHPSDVGIFAIIAYLFAHDPCISAEGAGHLLEVPNSEISTAIDSLRQWKVVS